MSTPSENHNKTAKENRQDDADSVSSYDFIPSPHNRIASLNGPPAWHEDSRNPDFQQNNSGSGSAAYNAGSPPPTGASTLLPFSLNASTFQSTRPYTAQDYFAERSETRHVRSLVERLINPPGVAGDPIDRVTVDLSYVHSVLPAGYMVWDAQIHRTVLRKDTDLARRGEELGLTPGYMAWLLGHDSSVNVFVMMRAGMEHFAQHQ